MKIELELKELPEEILEKLSSSIDYAGLEELAPSRKFLEWLEAHVAQGICDLFDDAGVEDDVDLPDVYAKEIK
jgi:hypothetical protein